MNRTNNKAKQRNANNRFAPDHVKFNIPIRCNLNMPYVCHALYTGRYAPLNRSKMANRWNISAEVETSVKIRDLECVYCRVAFSKIQESRRTMPTWEHIVNDIRLNSAENVALCCYSCNASKGAKSLEDWLKSKYCVLKGISRETVGLVVQKVLDT